jgi:hypothetical protein
MRTCTIRRVAYDERQGGRIFVADPSLRGRYMLVDPCVALRACPHCKAVPFEPCKGHSTYHVDVHYDRRQRGDPDKGRELGDIVIDEEIIIEPIAEEQPA